MEADTGKTKPHLADFFVYVLLIIFGIIAVVYILSSPANIKSEQQIWQESVFTTPSPPVTLAPTEKFLK